MTPQATKDTVLGRLHQWGWTKDRWGHMKKTTLNGKLLRIKVQARSFRLEKQVNICGKNEWLRISSGYFGSCRVEDDFIVIGSVRVKRPMLPGDYMAKIW
jgi:hypothetical protein